MQWSIYIIALLSFTKYLSRGARFEAINNLNLDGQTFLVTGAAGGIIGKATASELAKRGARVILFARK